MDATGISAPVSPANPRRDRFVAAAVSVLGLVTVVWLTRYNRSSVSIWSQTALPGGRSWDEFLLVNVCALLFLPWLLVFVVLREPAGGWGFAPPSRGAGLLAVALYLVMLPVMFVASRAPQFHYFYPLVPSAAYAWRPLLAHELIYGFYLFCWEWFYRGFLTFGLARGLGYPIAIVLQTIAFGVMHIGKPAPEVAGSFLAGLALGWLAVRARSFLPGFGVHWAVSATFDLLAIHGRTGGLF